MDAIPIYGNGMPRLIARQNHSEAHAYVRGGFGEEMDFACFSITSYLAALPGWHESQIDQQEVVYLAGFFAFVALVSSPSASLSPAEAATGARATVARRLMVRGNRPELLTERIRAFQKRLGEYSALWVGVLKSANSFGAFSLRVFENVQSGDKSRQGYLEHLDTFPDFCERRIKA
ncbi:MAG: hypothetical protein ACXW2G_12780, partial [Burkholderiaceae bacterium]